MLKTDEKTETMSILDTIKAMVPSRQIPAEQRKSTKHVNPESKDGTNYTAKDKAVLGIEADRSITWSFPNFFPEDSQRFKIIANEAGVTPGDLGSMIIMTWFEQNREEIDVIAGDVVTSGNSADDIAKKIAAANRTIANLMSKLETMKAKTE